MESRDTPLDADVAVSLCAWPLGRETPRAAHTTTPHTPHTRAHTSDMRAPPMSRHARLHAKAAPPFARHVHTPSERTWTHALGHSSRAWLAFPKAYRLRRQARTPAQPCEREPPSSVKQSPLPSTDDQRRSCRPAGQLTHWPRREWSSHPHRRARRARATVRQRPPPCPVCACAQPAL